MHPTLPESAATFIVIAVVAIYVALQRERRSQHWLLMCLLMAMMAWTGGLTAYFSVPATHSELALTVAFVGVFSVPPCWLLLAARHTHVRVFDRSPGWLMAVLVPPAMTSLAVVTNSGHRLFVRNFEPNALQANATTWAGPIFWIGIGFGVVLMLAGVCMYLYTAYRMFSTGQRARALALAAIVLFPAVASPLIGLQTHRDATPTLIGIMIIGLFVMNWRHRVLETLPIARRDVIEHLPEAVVICDNDGQILDLNRAAVMLFSSSEAELRSQHFALTVTELAQASERIAVEAECRMLLATGAPVQRQFKAGDGRLIELSASGVRGGDGEPSGFYALLRDRTEHRRHEEFVRQGDRMEIVASLTSGIAHEVNNPLAFVRANLHHIQRIGTFLSDEATREGSEKREEFEELKQVAEESLEGVKRIVAIVERMRRFSVMQDGAVASVDMNMVVDDAIRMSALWSGNDMPIRTDLAVFLPPVKGSAEHLVQAVLNLLVYAREAVNGRSDRLVRIETRRHVDEIEVRILDNGPGLPAELQARFLAPDSHAELVAGGEGLGLAIANGIVRDHGGTLDLEVGIEEGSAFVIRLPAAGSIC